MRAPFQILAIPYRVIDGEVQYCVLHRADHDQWQFIAGGGEDDETPETAAVREIWEECGVENAPILRLKSMCYIPTNIFKDCGRQYGWPGDLYVVPEYAFGFACSQDLALSHEHTECVWLNYRDAYKKLKWDSNRTALYELNCRLTKT